MNLQPWRDTQIPRFRPADWRLGVTVCIAATSRNGQELILVSDSKVAFGDFSADDAVIKNIPFLHPWAVLLAGDDISYAQSVINRARTNGLEKIEHEGELAGWQIAEILYDSLLSERQRIIEALILKKYGFTCETFRDQGKSLCTEGFYSDVIYKISQTDISLRFLLCGFNNDGNTEIWGVSSDSPPQNYDNLGFWAIGSGANGAISSLAHSVSHLGLDRFQRPELVLYHVLAAKFMSESAKDVGQGTFVVLIPQNDKIRFLLDEHVKKIRELWEKNGAPRIPENAEVLIKSSLFSVRRKTREKKLTKR